MRITMTWLVVLGVLVSTLSAPTWSLDLTAARGDKVSFPGTSPSGSVKVEGYLNRPQGSGAFPAMVMLPGCGGLGRGEFEYADWFKIIGYVTLAVDSLTPRHLTSGCFSGGQHPSDQETAGDAFGALAYLRSLPFVDGQRIGLIGWSRGGAATLLASSNGFAMRAQPSSPGFRLSIAYYPVPCDMADDTGVPLLVLVGELDDWHIAPVCEARGKQLQQQSRVVEVQVYPGQYHAFDRTGAEGMIRTGSGLHRIQYDPAAAHDAKNRVVKFLVQYMQ